MGKTARSDELQPRARWETERLVAWRRATDVPLAVLAIGSLPLLVLEVEQTDLVRADRLLLEIVNFVVLVAFAVDYVVELRLACNRWSFVRSQWGSLLIVVAQAVALLPSLAGVGSLRALRGVRLFRVVATIARVLVIGGVAVDEVRTMFRQQAGRFAIGLAGFTWISSAVAFTIAEDVGETGRLQSFFDALWWSTTTITTVGYGDVYPVTSAGRVVGAITMLVGIATFATVTARMAEFLVRSGEESGPG